MNNKNDFRNELKLKVESFYFRLFESIKINDELSISIQCSKGHYCSPRETIDIFEYNSMEIAFINYGELKKVSSVSEMNFYPRLKELYSSYSYGVYGYIDIELIQDIINYLRK